MVKVYTPNATASSSHTILLNTIDNLLPSRTRFKNDRVSLGIIRYILHVREENQYTVLCTDRRDIISARSLNERKEKNLHVPALHGRMTARLDRI